jgi:pyridoxamine 5'-phosphate oxidase
MAEPASLRDRLRLLPRVDAEFPLFDSEATPGEPIALLLEWLDQAIEAGVVQPQAMTLATSTADGHPSSRTILLKDVDATSLWFASLKSGPKGAELAENPEAALVLYWREQGRQIRVVGTVEEGPRKISEADFLKQRPASRALAIAGRQSEPIENYDAQLKPAQKKIAAHPDFVPLDWVAYRLTRESSGWVKDHLWP